jgi:hypothetical protein
MQKKGPFWVVDYTLPKGEYLYKFLLNDSIHLNDSYANLYSFDKHKEVWSILNVSDSHQRIYNTSFYTIHLDDYLIYCHNDINETTLVKKQFNLLKDTNVTIQFAFSNISGLHSATVLWFSPTGEIFDYAEEMLFAQEGNPYFLTYFSLNLFENKDSILDGTWRICLFLDGRFILSDYFHLHRTATYSSFEILSST